ncbi:MAG: PLP-dependent transferase, partial [Thermoplasmatota archaeon]
RWGDRSVGGLRGHFRALARGQLTTGAVKALGGGAAAVAIAAALEGGAWGLAFSSGMAATDAIAHLLESGDHVVMGDDVYGGTYRLFAKVFDRAGIELTPVDMRHPGAVRKAVRKRTKLVWIESPTNPLLKVIDIAEMAGIARDTGEDEVLSFDMGGTTAKICFIAQG